MKNELSNEPQAKTNTDIGKKGELLAANFLAEKGYEMINKNYRSGRAEIDLIAKKDNLLIFVEVKFRKNVLFGFPEGFVDKGKETRIKTVAENYIFEKNWQSDIRFDIISIVDKNGKIQIEHFEDCF